MSITITEMANTDSFGVWFNKTNAIIQALENVVTMDSNNSDDVVLDGNLSVGNTLSVDSITSASSAENINLDKITDVKNRINIISASADTFAAVRFWNDATRTWSIETSSNHDILEFERDSQYLRLDYANNIITTNGSGGFVLDTPLVPKSFPDDDFTMSSLTLKSEIELHDSGNNTIFSVSNTGEVYAEGFVSNVFFHAEGALRSRNGLRILDNSNNVVSQITGQGVATLTGLTVNGDTALGANVTIDSVALTSTAAELNLLDGVTSTTTQLNYLSSLSGDLQISLDDKQDLDSSLSALSGLTPSANLVPMFTSPLTSTTLTVDGNTALGTSNTSIPTQEAVKEYVDTEISSNGITQTSGAAGYFGARAWGSISGASLVGNQNIASITPGTNLMAITFTDAMPDTNYSVVALPTAAYTSGNEYLVVSDKSTTGFNIYGYKGTSLFFVPENIDFTVHR